MEVVEKKTDGSVDAKLVAKLTTQFEKAESSYKTKKYMVELDKTLVKFYTESFLTGITWKGYECYAISELNTAFKKAFKTKTTALFGREHIEATFHFIKNFEGTGSVEMAETMRKFCDAFAKPMNEIQVDIQELKDVATELQAAENGITVDEFVKAVSDAKETNGPE